MPAQENNAKKFWLVSGLVVLICLLLAGYTHLSASMLKQRAITDTTVLYRSATLLNMGKNPYIRPPHIAPLSRTGAHRTTIPNLSPPFTTMVASAACRVLSEPMFSLLFRVLNMVLNFFTVFLLIRHFFKIETLQVFFWSLLVSYAFVPTFYAYVFGEPTLMLNFLVVSSFILYQRKKDLSAGAILGLAINIKLFFGIFLFLFLAQKRYKALLGLLVTAAGLALIPVVIYGLAPYWGYLKLISEIDWYPLNWNASYFGVLCRIFGDPTNRFHSLWHTPVVTHVLYYLIFCFYLVIIMRLGKRLKDNADAAYGLVISSMLLLSPLGWYYYIPLLQIAFISYFKKINTKQNYSIYLGVLAVILLIFNVPTMVRVSPETSLLFQLTVANYLFVALFIFHIGQWFLYFDRSKRVNKSLYMNKLLYVFTTAFLLLTAYALSGFI